MATEDETTEDVLALVQERVVEDTGDPVRKHDADERPNMGNTVHVDDSGDAPEVEVIPVVDSQIILGARGRLPGIAGYRKFRS